ncbi:DUF1735 and LamG domain-containing protein [Phocaeicola coprocola]|uniref:BT-3987-like N-terminal domain-containing protein n=1 Tax=Phocaeicola coprocola CAG:162 TaxID=1263040 RepID=R6CDG5_9BACT|nr:DUF1735 and LamG domain-containing protein [Phocaeicola coprocola]CDA70969.1 putative uncharacterized protein [Phocaeicola coprocola CAG:162]
MKSLYRKLGLLSVVLMGLSFSACDDAKYKPVDTGLYLAETNTKSLVGKKIISEDDGHYNFTITPRLISPIDQDVTMSLGIDKEFLNQYNARYGTSLEVVPDEYVEFSNKEITLKAGEVLSSTVEITIKPLSKEMVDSGKKYALPVGIVGANTSLLAGASSILYQLEKTPIVTVPILNSQNNAKFSMTSDYSLTQWSVEFCVNIDKLGTAIGQLNNQAMFSASAPDGMDGEIYTRFGDAPIKGNIFQVKNQGTQINSNMEFSTNTWYHLAIVCDGATLSLYVNGELDNQIAVTGKVTNLEKNKFGFGNTDYLKANVKVSELRFWTKAISQTQIKENMYSIDPTTEGLEAYWKMDEGSGNDFKDYTGHGNNGHSVGTTVWSPNERLDGKQ